MVLGFDLETEMITDGRKAPPVICASFAKSLEDAQVFHWSEVLDVLPEVLNCHSLVGHNVAFDMSVVCAQWPHLIPDVFRAYEENRVECTMIREKLVAIANGNYRFLHLGGSNFRKLVYSLEEVVELRLGIEMDKSWQSKFFELRDVPFSFWPEEAMDYAVYDAVATLLVRDHQEIDKKYLADQYRQVRAAFWLQLMSCWGFATDAEGVRAFAEKTQREYDEILGELQALGLVRKNGVRDTKAVQARVAQIYLANGLKVPLTGGGTKGIQKPKTDADTCTLSKDPVLIKYSDLSSLKKTLSTDVPLLQRGVIHTHFEELLETGRTSSSPNIQNLPTDPGVRECFVPRPGWVFAVCDYSGIELRTWAQICFKVVKFSKMAEALNAGMDPHIEVARRILDIPYDEAFADYKQNPLGRVYKPRQSGKVANFGFPGGLGPETFVDYARKNYGVVVEPDFAVELQQFWREAWSESGPYFDWVSSQTEVEFPQIKQFCSNRFRGNVRFTEAANGFFQGLASDIAKAAGFLIFKACYAEPSSPLYGCRPVNFVHDEFVTEVPDNERAHDAAHEQARLMKVAAEDFIPDVPAEVEPMLCRRWSKGAKPIYDASGRLVPWDVDLRKVAA